MKHRPFIKVAVVLLIAFFAASIYQRKDIIKPINKAENIVISSLAEVGITNQDVLSRVEKYWENQSTKGKTVFYVFGPKVPIRFTELTSLLRREIKRLNGIDLSRISYNRCDTGGGIVCLEITAEDNIIISIEISNVLPVWKINESAV